jgi:hypothetical protein
VLLLVLKMKFAALTEIGSGLVVEASEKSPSTPNPTFTRCTFTPLEPAPFKVTTSSVAITSPDAPGLRVVLSVGIYYAIRMSEVESPTAGMLTVNVPAVDVISAPKFNTATALFDLLLLYINAPRAVMVLVVHAGEVKSSRAVVLVPDTEKPEIVIPAAVYPVPDTSLVAAYAVVVASSVAADVYSAIL